MTKTEATLECGQFQYLVGSKYKTEGGDILEVESVLLWCEGGDNDWAAHAFFVQTIDDSIYEHENVNNLGRYAKL